jgi:DNA primase
MNIFDFIKSQIAILDIVQEYTTLKRAGGYWKGLCPFHGEKTASFTVSPHRQIFYCFGCHVSGDVISFIAKSENCSQIEAAKFIAERYNLELPANVAQEYQQIATNTSEKERYFALCRMITDWCQLNLEQTKSVRDYLENRHISPQVMQDFKIGYFPKGPQALQALIKFAQNQNFLANDLLDTHIIQKNHDHYFSGFEDRLIFPIQDHLGRFCAFGGRIFKPGDDRVKYYNSHEHAHFNKRATLFGLSLAKKAIQQAQNVFVVEGYIDCIAMHQAGFKNTVATLGTACTSEHIDILARLADKLQVLYDSDKAGMAAVEKLATLCWNANLEIKVVELPPEQDPASYLGNQLNNQTQDLKKLITEAKDIYRFVISKTTDEFANQNLSKKMEASNKIIEMINKVADPIKRNILLQTAAQTLGMNVDLLALPKATNTNLIHQQAINPELAVNDSLETQLFIIFINNPHLFLPKYHYLASYLEVPAKTILQKLIALKGAYHDNLSLALLMEKLDEVEQGFVRKSLLTYNDKMVSSIDQTLAQFHKKHWKTIVGHIKSLLVQEKSDPEKIRQIIQNFQVLKSEIVDGGTH